eukprot:TRINITY_DN1581_c0_g1_i2.p1 TRINITY_DN1581_c0_g1~~TRINITY_DN1581_c0_g1_i2.p1  ORF type:complete len:776 (+),score=354.39 TRINITY_DN1581_c0_g1_i2:73-2328(+)
MGVGLELLAASRPGAAFSGLALLQGGAGPPPSSTPGSGPAAAHAAPPPADERGKARRLYDLEREAARVEEALARFGEQRSWMAQRNIERAESLQQRAEELATVQDGLEQGRCEGQRRLKDIKIATDTARARLSLLEAEGERKRRARDEAETLYKKEHSELRMQLAQGAAERERDGTETRLLLRMLHAERDKWEHDCRELQARLEVQIREDAKNTILLGLLNSQLMAARQEGGRLRTDAARLVAKQRGLEADLSTKQERTAMLKRELDRGARQHAAMKEDHVFRVARIEQDHERQQALVDGLRQELAAQQAALQSAQKAAALRSREWEEVIARRRAEQSKMRDTVGALSQRVRELRDEEFAQQQLRSTECEKLGIARAGLKQRDDESSMARFQTLAEQASEVEILKAQVALAQNRRQCFQDDAEVRLAELKVQTEAHVRQTVLLRGHAEERDRESFETVARLAAENQALQRRVTELQASGASRDEAHVAERVSMRSESGRYAREVVELEASIDQHNREHCERVVELQRELARLNEREENRAGEMRKERHDMRDATELAAREGLKKQQLLRTMADQSRRQDEHRREREVAYKAEMRALKQEVREAQNTVAELEAKVAETHGYRVLAEENKLLEADLQDCKNLVSAHSNTIATMRVEKGLLEGYKTKVLREQCAKHERKAQELADQRQAMRPLLQEIVVTAAKHHVADSAVQAALRCARDIGLGVQLHPAPPAAGKAQSAEVAAGHAAATRAAA